MNQITRMGGAAVAVAMTLTLGSGAWAAESACGQLPTAPAIPADGGSLPSKEMDALVEAVDAYQNKFIEVNDCATKEFNSVQEKLKATIAAYQDKNKGGGKKK